MTPSLGRKTLLITGASGLLGSALIEAAGGQFDIIGVLHKKPLARGSIGDAVFDPNTSTHFRSQIRAVTCDLESPEAIVAVVKN